ncbi:hypothetical protein [Agarilytica rhodophyticola]|uniref:hypothetical protein n=1 Tax=Agarilytica rhodophyticola TaxID=1737490 RepID=UPI000B341DD3|nr:hypothetical protein [Agarilytica rhodophyticola]
MKTQHLDNGNLIVTQGSKPVLVIFGIAAFLFFAKGAFLWVFNEEITPRNTTLAVLIIMLTLLFFYRVWSLNSKFKFDNIEKSIEYTVQYPFFNKKGIIPINHIEKALVETDSDGASRIIIKCDNEEIPMSAAVKSLGKHNLVCDEINKWLEKNN